MKVMLKGRGVCTSGHFDFVYHIPWVLFCGVKQVQIELNSHLKLR